MDTLKLFLGENSAMLPSVIPWTWTSQPESFVLDMIHASLDFQPETQQAVQQLLLERLWSSSSSIDVSRGMIVHQTPPPFPKRTVRWMLLKPQERTMKTWAFGVPFLFNVSALFLTPEYPRICVQLFHPSGSTSPALVWETLCELFENTSLARLPLDVDLSQTITQISPSVRPILDPSILWTHAWILQWSSHLPPSQTPDGRNGDSVALKRNWERLRPFLRSLESSSRRWYNMWKTLIPTLEVWRQFVTPSSTSSSTVFQQCAEKESLFLFQLWNVYIQTLQGTQSVFERMDR